MNCKDIINTSLTRFFACVILCLLGSGSVYAEKNCQTCHEDDKVTSSLLHRAHGQTADPRLPGGSALCETCHGESVAHKQNPRKNVSDNFFGAPNVPTETSASEVCTTCHNTGHQKSWAVSEHAMADVECHSCHTIHSNSDPVQNKATQSQVCLTCHAEQKADAMKFSRHPVTEGIVACTDCHSPHGGKGPGMLVEATINETCYQCHTEKRGPFLWEHEPVQDDCTNCHTPHGSINDNLLIIRQPLLCQQCHISTSHRGTNYIKEGFSSGSDYVYGKSCLNCHGEIHGTNHAQGGAYFE